MNKFCSSRVAPALDRSEHQHGRRQAIAEVGMRGLIGIERATRAHDKELHPLLFVTRIIEVEWD